MSGPGIVISNPSYTGVASASGTFTGGLSAGIGIDSGVILTSGDASDAVGPNSAINTQTNNGQAGDPDLDALIPGFATHDAVILEFDFTTTSGDLFFNYVFGSEEYNEWVGTAYNDVFGFFVDPAGPPPQVNIALIPGTSTPVSINNVNLGSNPAFYINNDVGTYNIEYDGFTKVLSAQFLGLGPGTHHIKLAIADAGDFILDSAVFLESASFTANNPDDQIIGGELIPIDSAALLIAGAESNSFSILGTVALIGSVAIGTFFFKSKRKN